MLAVEHLSREFEEEDGFFLQLHQRTFDGAAGKRALEAIRSCSLTDDHIGNYEKLWWLWSMQIEIWMYLHRHSGGEALKLLESEMFDEFVRIFDVELRKLASSENPGGSASVGTPSS